MAKDFIDFCGALLADQRSASTREIRTVVVLAGRGVAHVAGTENLRFFAVIKFEPAIKNVERTFPQPRVFEPLGVPNDAAIDLVHLFESTILHDERQDLAANSAGAIGDNGFVFEVVIGTALEHFDKFGSCFYWRDNSVLEFADRCFVFISSIKEDHVVSTRCDKFIDFGRRQVNTSTNDAVFIDNDFFRNTKGHDLVAHANLQTRELVATPFGPLVLHVFERREVLHDPDVALDLIEGSAHGSVDPIFRDQNTTT